MRLYADDAQVLRTTRALLAQGQRVLQTHYLAASEREHVRALLDFFAPPENAVVLDLGCGVGRVAELMQDIRPDLDFILLNRSEAQLMLCPPRFQHVHADYECLPAGMAVDAVMVQYAIGHGDIGALMHEAAKVLPEDGVLCVYDLVAESPTPALRALLDYRDYSADDVRAAAKTASFRCDRAQVPPETYTDHFRQFLDAASFAAIFATVHPMLFRFVKC